MNIKKHKIDSNLSNLGVWLDFDGSRFLVASTATEDFQRYSARAYRKLNSAAAKLDPMLAIKVSQEALATCCLLDWENVMDGETPVPYSKENALMLVREAPEFREWLSAAAGDLANFQREALAEDAEALKSGAVVES